MAKTPAHGLKLNYRYLLLVGLLALALYVLVPQFASFQSSWQQLSQPDLKWTALAVGFTFLTYLAGSATYCLLAFKRLKYWRTVLAQLAAMFVNRLLPGGLGALGVNYLYLRHSKHTVVQAGSVTAINNLLGGFGHWLLVLLTLAVTSGGMLAADDVGGRYLKLLLAFLAAAALLTLVLLIIFGRRKVVRKIIEIRRQLASYRRRPWRLAAALLSSMTLTAFNVLCLACCAMALGIDLPLAAILLVLTFGVGAGTAIPTPGGLGGFEAGLVAGFAAYGIDASTALAAALLYRLVSYWLPLVPGAIALAVCQKRKLLVT